MSDLVVRGGQVLTPRQRVDADVVVRDGRIVAVLAGAGAGAGDGIPVLDATGLVVAPGFLDVQCNGAGGIDLATTPEQLWEVASLLPRWGVTAWLPTIVSSPEPIRQRALDALHRGPPSTGARATPLGLHFEGPFLAPERRGAHIEAHLRPPDLAAVAGWSRDAGVAVATLAPELDGALDLVRALVDGGVVVSLGHSDATAEQVTAAVNAGARGVTHLFNAMTPFHHRAPGLAGVALTDERLWVGTIADGLHLHPRVLQLAVRALGPRLVLVSDATAALGAAPGQVRLGDHEPMADGAGVRLPDGTLAGTAAGLDQGVAHVLAAGARLEDAVAAATTSPARVLGLEHERGMIAPGAVGDLVLLDVREPSAGAKDGGPHPTNAPTLAVVATVIGGEIAHTTPEARSRWRS